jgi:hypothetical protein
MLTKIADSWIDISLVTAVDPYMDDPAKAKSVVHLKNGSHIVSATADDAATAINEALAKWKESQK